MSQVLTVPTHFNDLGELSEGFLDRVEQDTLILYGPVAYEDGSEIEFAVLLADGSPALEGTGRVRAAVDGGADRVPETRYDVVVEALELDGRSSVVFERLVLARQAVSEHPPTAEEEVDTFSISPDEVLSVAPEGDDVDTVPPEIEDAPDTVPPEASDEDDDEYDDEPATVIAAVDAEAMMAEADTEPESEPAAESLSEPVMEMVVESEPVMEMVAESEPFMETVIESEPVMETVIESEPVMEAVVESVPASEAVTVSGSEPAVAISDDDAVLEAGMTEESDSDAEPVVEDGPLDSEYAFEHGIAAEPQVGMPVPIPSMAAPPEAPPAPPTLRLAEPPEGLTRPSVAQAEEALFSTDGEVSDVHTTGLFAYENELPIPSRPPLPDLNRPASVRPVEAASDYDVEESEPPEANDDEYEEVRLSDFAEAAEEG